MGGIVDARGVRVAPTTGFSTPVPRMHFSVVESSLVEGDIVAKKQVAARPPSAKPVWSVAHDCLGPLGELMKKLSRNHGISKSGPWLPIELWSAYRTHKLDLAIVCLEVGVSVPFADRVQKRTRSVLRRWERLHWDAVQSMGVTLGDDAIRMATTREFEVWRERYPNGPPWNEYPKDSIAARAGEVAYQLQETGTYLLQAAAAVVANFSLTSIPRKEADHATSAGRPKEDHKRDSIREGFDRGLTSGKEITAYVKAKLKTTDNVSPKMISEVKKSMKGQKPKE